MSLFLFALACSVPEDTHTAPAAAADPALHGKIGAAGDRDVLYLWGTREEMGYAEGALLCDRVAPLFKDYLLEHLVTNYSDYTYEVARTYILVSTKFEEDDLAELTAMYQGMVDHCTEEQLTIESEFLEPDAYGSRVLEFEDLLFANALADFGCSSFSVWGDASATGDTLHGRNFDWAADPQGTFLDDHILKVYDSTDEGARFVSLMVPAMAGCITCVTEEGVGITMHNVGGLDPTFDVDISPRIAAARAALVATWQAPDVVDAAEQVLESRRQYTGNNLHLSFPLARGDGTTGAVVFEYDGDSEAPDGQVTVRRPGEDPALARLDAIVATNHYVKREPPDTSGDSFERARTLRAAVDTADLTGGLDVTAGRALLASVALSDDTRGVTAHSILIDSANRQLQIFVAPSWMEAAPDFDPVIVDLDALFGELP